MPRLEDIPPETVADTVARAVTDAVAQGGGTEAIVARALARAKADLGLSASSPVPSGAGGASPTVIGRPAAAAMPAGPPPAAPSPAQAAAHAANPARVVNPGGRIILTEDDVRTAARAGQSEIRVPRGSVVTSLARDVAADTGVRIVEEG
jgi:hypothetical protein